MTATSSSGASSSSSKHPRKPPQLQSSNGDFHPLPGKQPQPLSLHYSPKFNWLKEEVVQHPTSSLAKPINKPLPSIQGSLKGGMWRRGKVIKRHQRDGRKGKKKGILKGKEGGKQLFPIDTIALKQKHPRAQLHISAGDTRGSSRSTRDPGAGGLCASPKSFKRTPVNEFPEVSASGWSLGKLRQFFKSWLGFCSQQSHQLSSFSIPARLHRQGLPKVTFGFLRMRGWPALATRQQR